MKAAIYGSYSFGNYGDDIMAIQFALHLQKLGLESYVYRLDKSLAKKYDINSVDSLDELLKDAAFCLIGGGGFLIDNLTNSVDREFDELLEKSLKYSCPFYPISIGGEGQGANASLSTARHSFFSHAICENPTVRLVDDVELFKKFGRQALYYPDVLLSVSKAWDIYPAEAQDNMVRVGINLPDSAQMRLLFAQLKLITLYRKNIVFYFIPTYLPSSEIAWEFFPEKESANLKLHNYVDPQSTLNFLATLDLVISYKLHLGLSSIAVGTPFYSVGGSRKTKAFLREIDAEFAIRPAHDKLAKLAWLLASPEKILALKQQYDWKKLEKLQHDSWGHMDQISKIAAQIRSSPVRIGA